MNTFLKEQFNLSGFRINKIIKIRKKRCIEVNYNQSDSQLEIITLSSRFNLKVKELIIYSDKKKRIDILSS